MSTLLPPGTPLLGGEYVVVAHLGSGAFADVYHVVCPAMGDAPFALKLIRPDADRGVASELVADYEARFRLEAALAAKIHDPRMALAGREHVIQVYRVGRDEATGAACAVMELAPGGSLADRLAAGGPVAAAEAVPLMLGMLRGLSAVHAVGAIHRDIKPANILLGAGSMAKIADLGLAQVAGLHGAASVGRRSIAGSMGAGHPGTPEYMSPEHRHPEVLLPTSDMYGVGAVMFEVLTGRPWYQGRLQWDRPGEAVAGLPAWLDAVVARMLVLTPGQMKNQRADETVRWVLVEDAIGAVEAGRASEAALADMERASQAQAEREALAAEEKAEREQAEAERQARELAETERLAREQAAAERQARERAEAERKARERAEVERKAREKAESEARARAEAERRAREEAEMRARFASAKRAPYQPQTGWEDRTKVAAGQLAGELTMRREREDDETGRANVSRLLRQGRQQHDALDEYRRIRQLAHFRDTQSDARAAWKRFKSTYPYYGDPDGVSKLLPDDGGLGLIPWVMVGVTVLFFLAMWTVMGEGRQDEAGSVGQGAVGTATRADARTTSAPADAKQLMDVMLDFSRPPEERAEAGRQLAAIGDPRAGVGLRPDGVPDIAWVEVTGGAFLIGDDDEPSWKGAWAAQRTVDVPGFWMSRYETTWTQYEAFLTADDGYRNPAWWEGLAGPAEDPGEQTWPLSNHPAEKVGWYDAVAYTRWLGARLGYAVRLPTEEEWEKGARGTDGRRYPWGDAYEEGRANIDERWPEDGPAGTHYLERTAAVGLYLQGNPYGLEDMAGNVWEWTLTDWNTGASDDLGGTSPRVVRGGSWGYDPDRARAASRNGYDPVDRVSDLGFRVVSSAPVDSDL